MLNKLKTLSSRTKIIIAVVGIPLLVGIGAFGYWTISPLFYDRVVNESLDDAIAAAESESQSESGSGEVQSVSTSDSEVVVLQTGNFVDADPAHTATGTANLIDLGNENYVVRFEEGFETTNGPDLYVWLTNGTDPDEGYIDLGVLKGNVGAQNYPVPEGTDLSAFDTVIIWCKAFSVLFGSAGLVDAVPQPEEVMATGGEVDIVAPESLWGADRAHEATGTANIIALNSEMHILRFEEGFETTNGPDLYVWLTVDGDTNKGLVDLGLLKGTSDRRTTQSPQGQI